VGELVLLEHFRLDQGLHGIDLAISLLLNQLDFSKGTLSDNLDRVVVLGLILGAQETQILAFFSSSGRPELLASGRTLGGILEFLLQLALSITARLATQYWKDNRVHAIPLVTLARTLDTVLEEVGSKLGALLLVAVGIGAISVGISLGRSLELLDRSSRLVRHGRSVHVPGIGWLS
jgi:hypothetical protein